MHVHCTVSSTLLNADFASLYILQTGYQAWNCSQDFAFIVYRKIDLPFSRYPQWKLLMASIENLIR